MNKIDTTSASISQVGAVSVIDVPALAARLKATAGVKSRQYQVGHSEGREHVAECRELDELEALIQFDIDAALSEAESPWEAACLLARAVGLEDATWLFGDDAAPQQRCDAGGVTANRLRGFQAGAQELFLELQPHL